MRAGAELDVVFFGFEHKCTQALHLSLQFLRCAVDRGESRHRELAGVGSGESGVHVALGVEAGAHRDHVGMNVQHVGDDLGGGGFVSLALRAGADCDHDFAVDIELAVRALRIAGERRTGIDDLRLAEIVGAGIERGADADSDQAAFFARCGLLLLPVVPADLLFRQLEHLGIVSRVVDASVGSGVGKFFRANVVAQAHLVGRNSQLVGANVDHALQEPQVLHAGVAAIGADRTFVGDRLREIDARILEAINAGKHLRPDHAAQRLVARIGAAVVDVAGREGGDHAVLVEGDSSVAESSLIAVGARSDVLGARFHPLDRASAGFSRGQRAHRHLRIAGDLDAEAAADVGSLDADAVDVHVQMRGQKLDGK